MTSKRRRHEFLVVRHILELFWAGGPILINIWYAQTRGRQMELNASRATPSVQTACQMMIADFEKGMPCPGKSHVLAHTPPIEIKRQMTVLQALLRSVIFGRRYSSCGLRQRTFLVWQHRIIQNASWWMQTGISLEETCLSRRRKTSQLETFFRSIPIFREMRNLSDWGIPIVVITRFKEEMLTVWCIHW